MAETVRDELPSWPINSPWNDTRGGARKRRVELNTWLRRHRSVRARHDCEAPAPEARLLSYILGARRHDSDRR